MPIHAELLCFLCVLYSLAC
uniref:Uncharacterized protein n=1 Tax=Arundo donax TaxID=35708 RepID=A0A0A9ENJ9_ARUDO